jgi:cell division protein FtsZ
MNDRVYTPVDETPANAFEFNDVRQTIEEIRRKQQGLAATPTEDLSPEERRRRLEEAQRRREEVRNRPLQVTKLSSPQTVIELENQPAYLRKNIALDDVPDAGGTSISNWTISLDDEIDFKMSNNSFLHDRVD